MTPVDQSFDDDERALSRALHGRVEHMNDSPLDVQDVDSRAQRIRRNRRVMVGAGVAAAVAVLVPTAFVAGGFLDGDDTPPPASQTAAPSPSEAEPTPTPTESAGTDGETSRIFDVSDLSTGAGPGLAYAELAFDRGQEVGGTIHAPDGSEIALPPYGLMEFAPVGDQWVVAGYDTERDAEYVYLLAANGDHGDPWEVSGGFALSPAGNVAAWTGTDGTVYALQAGGDVRTIGQVPSADAYGTAGVLGEDCSAGAGCTVLVNRNDRQTVAYAVGSDGSVDTVPGLLGTGVVGADRVGGVVSIDETAPGSCSRMLDGSFTELWETCANTLRAIAPDGQHLLGLPAYLDGFGPTTLDVLDMADGSAVQSWTSNRRSATYFDEVWEEDSHVLVVTYQQGEWAVVRLGVDGSMEYAVAPVPGEDLQRPVMLQTR